MTTTQQPTLANGSRPQVDSLPSSVRSDPHSGMGKHDQGSSRGIEVRVHGIGDHATYSALGKPHYKELVDSRVWIGEVPHLPPHKLRLVNWSRANRKLTRHLNWYLAFPFTLLNVAGYMEPEKPRLRRTMRVGIGIASVCLTLAMAAWITIIIETAWRGISDEDDRLTDVVLQGLGPGLLIAFIVYRMIIGRVLVDKGGTAVSLVGIAVLFGLMGYLHRKPASRKEGWFHSSEQSNWIDPMTPIVVYTTAIVGIIAAVLLVFAIKRKENGANLAGAALLIVLAVTLLHTAGSILRLFIDSVFAFIPATRATAQHASRAMAESLPKMEYVLLPQADDLAPTDTYVIKSAGTVLRIDLIPVFFVVMLAILGALIWLKLWCRSQHIKSNTEQTSPKALARKDFSRTHTVVQGLPGHLASVAATAMVLTVAAWSLLAWGFAAADTRLIALFLLGLKIVGGVVIVLVLIRRPERVAEMLRRTFGSVADIAGFWAPDLHPLAGASYRRALLAGLRQTITDLILDFPNERIALVGHSQGSVVCAWFVRGGHWTEQPSEATTDRIATEENLYRYREARASNRIALYTCGSPLDTLYATFFPRYFNASFFATTEAMTNGHNQWRNYWRKTDPIGSPLNGVPAVANHDVTEYEDEETLGHSDYWLERQLRNDINGYLGADLQCGLPLRASS